MPLQDLTARLLPGLEANRLALDLGPEVFYPAYRDGSIANLPASILHWLGADPLPSAAPALAPEILNYWGRTFRQVVLLIVDGFGLDMIQAAMSASSSDPRLRVWGSLPADALLAPLTSIVPSTTAAALTTFWTGAYPAEHSVIGYQQYLKEYGLIANMILHNPAAYQGDPGSLRHAGFNPETFLPVPGLAPHLARQDVRVQALQHRAIARSGLSTMLFSGAAVQPIYTLGDLFISLGEQLDSGAGRPSYIYLYWSELDDLAHRYSPSGPRFSRELADFSLQFELFLEERLRSPRGDTLLLVTADHGHLPTPRRPELEIRRYPELIDCLAMLPSGEARLPYAFLRPGAEERFRELVERIWPGRFTLVPSADFIRAGMFGPRGTHPRVVESAGDFVLIPRPGDYWWFDPFHDNPLLGRHGGLSRTEMLVPLLGIEL